MALVNRGKEGRNMGIFRKKKSGLLSEGYLWMAMAALLYGFSLWTRRSPALLEQIYPARINRAIIRLLSQLTGIFPFSVGELFLYVHVFLAVFLLLRFVMKLFGEGAFTLLYRTVSYGAMLYVVFMLVFGLNYNRASVREAVGLEKAYYTAVELKELNRALIARANALRAQVAEDEKGVFTLKESTEATLKKAQAGYDALGDSLKVYQGTYGRPKGVFLSEPMNYTGITGVFMPFTGEANVNVKGPDLLYPATILHEMAHQRGIAYEDEANYLSFVVSTAHPEVNFQYSGTVLALMSSMNALYRADNKAFTELYGTYSEGLRRDMKAYREFYIPYEGKVEKAATQVNDTYLKSNGQTSGVSSYGEMVNLLLEQFVQKGSL